MCSDAHNIILSWTNNQEPNVRCSTLALLYSFF